ncbi:MAG: M28 family peptidase [Chitinophagaceae bacterium]|nr:M28 family peptidase [Chitinophagaceae bacterium]
MVRLLLLLVFATQALYAQKSKKSKNTDNIILSNLQAHVGFLADDKLEGRRTGSPGEKLAYEYISNQFSQIGLTPRGDNGGYIQDFEVNEGRQINKTTRLLINNFVLVPEKDFFPFAFSANGTVEASPTIALAESGTIWFLDLKEMLEENKNNPHFDLSDAIRLKSNDVAGKGATGLIVYNSSAIADELKFEAKAKPEAVKIPVVYITNNMKKRFMKDESAVVNINMTVDIGDKKRTGHNVIGYIDNGATTTVILGAHYDHLGYGEDKNSLFTGPTPAIHNGADDNASGTAALIELGKLLKTTASKKNNYLFISFSGEELGLFGSKYFTEHPTIELSTANFMINLDMVGRLSDSTHGLSIGGYGTSPVWGELLKEKDDFFTIKFDSSGTGPSDHTSFYRKDIPVLFFFTGVHGDYHKPSDDADKINYSGELQVVKYIYNLIGAADGKGRLAFSKTREAQSSGKSSFRVTLGIMPDYTYSGGGVRVDGVSDGKLAQRVGIKAGDVVIQLGDHKIPDVQGYMETLGKFKKGDATKVKVKRGTEEVEYDIVF